MKEVITGLINNLVILLALSVLYSYVSRRWETTSVLRKVIVGILFGAVTIAGMMNSFDMHNGVIFDGRSVIISLSAVFGGILTAIITSLIAIMYRLFLGGSGSLMGVLVILSSAALGLIFNSLNLFNLRSRKVLSFFILGLAVHIIMLLLMFTLPGHTQKAVFTQVAAPVLIIFPIATAFLGFILTDEERRNVAVTELKNNEALLNETQKLAKLGGWEYIVATKELIWTDEVYSIYEIKKEKGLSLFEMSISGFSPQDRKILESAFSELLENGTPYNLEFPMNTFKNRLIWIQTSARPVYSRGKIVRVSGNIKDITERKHASEALQTSEAKFRALVEQSLTGIYILQPDRFLYVNHQFTEIFGYSRAEILSGMGPRDLIIEEDIQMVVNNIQQRISGKIKSLRYVARGKHKNGSTIWIEIHGSNLDIDRESVIAGTILDITEQKKTEERIQKSEEKYRQIVETANEGIWVIDEHSNTSFVNQKMAEILGYTVNEMLNKSLYDFMDKQEIDTAEINVEKRKHGVSEEHEFKFNRKDGQPVWVLINTVPLTSNRDAYTGALAMVTDITSRKKTEEELAEYRNHLELLVQQKTKDLEAFTYSVSHDLKAPLRAISGFSDILLEDYIGKMDNEAVRLLKIIISNADKMRLLIDDLLEFSRLGKKEIHAANIPTNKLIDEIKSEFEQELQNRNVQWDIEKLPEIIGDHSMVKQIFVNLISNAIKFTRKRKNTLIKIGCEKEGENNVFFVSDNGVGFDMNYVDKIFQVFHRLHSLDEFEGSGVGLAIVHRIILKHGGKIWAEGEINKGATIKFIIKTKSEIKK
ncbi:MAG: PAS domain S-box protein [Bacteroidales bacterium]|nr:PAS domain S-box protein [Bacteroidales bacterium]